MSADPMPSTPPPRILLFARVSNVFGMIEELRKRSVDTYFCIDNKRQTVPPGMTPFTLREAWKLRKAARENRYDLVVCCAAAEALWRQDRGWFSNLTRLLKRLLFMPSALGLYLVPWILSDSRVPLAIFDWDDTTLIARKNWGLLARATCYFKIQSPRNPFKAFLFQDKRNDCVMNITKQPVYQDWARKLRPISIGISIPPNAAVVKDPEKKTDVFFAGSVHYSWVRIEGVRQLEELREEGYNIDIHLIGPGKVTLPRDEFLRRCSEAWLVLSPEGGGWDCPRHYQSLLMGSVPLLNHPDTRRLHPLMDGVHAFYYGVEDSDLKRVVRLALKDKERLRTMAREGQAFIGPNHTHPALAEYLIAETLKTARAPSSSHAI